MWHADRSLPRARALVLALVVVAAVCCGGPRRGPTDQQVIAAVRKSPPAPPTLGPTYLAQIASVEIQARGRYDTAGEYWPVRVRVRGKVRLKATNMLSLALADADAKARPAPVDFVEEARLAKDGFGNWEVSYHYDPKTPRWRLDKPGSPESRR